MEQMTSETLKRKIQIVVGTAVAVMACLVLVVAVQLIVISVQKAEERSLRAKYNQLLELQGQQDALTEYLKSDRFKAEYALTELHKGQFGSQYYQ